MAATADPAFAQLDDNTRHNAFASATQVMLQTGKLEQAAQFARAATQMSQQDLDDWRARLSVAMQLHDTPDELLSVTFLDRRWGLALVGLKGQEWRPPTRVYAVWQSTFDLLYKPGSGMASVYYGTDFSNDIVINISVDKNEPYFDAFYGYSSAVLANAYPGHFPYWYRRGFAQVFGAAQVKSDKVIVGGYDYVRASPLLNHNWIPIKEIFDACQGDPQFNSKESWPGCTKLNAGS